MNSIITPQTRAKREARQRIEVEVSSRYAKEMKSGGIWRRVEIWLTIQKEVRAELKRKFPPHALYSMKFAR